MTEPVGNNFWVTMEVVAKRRRLILALVLAATIIAAIISFLLPPWFEAQALLMPPKEVGTTNDQTSKLSEFASMVSGLNLPVMVSPSDVYAKLLRSERVTDRIVEKFDLKKKYGTGTHFETYEALMSHARFTATPEGLLIVSVEDKDPQVAADMANAFGNELNAIGQEIVSDRATRSREIIQGRFEKVKAALDTARTQFSTFQNRYKTIDFDAQTQMALDMAASLRASLVKLEMDIAVNEQTLGKDNPELVEMQRQRDFVIKQLSQLESGGKDSSFFTLPISSIPTLKGQYQTLYSRVKVNELLYSMLMEQLEKAKLQEEAQSLSITFLDKARAPEIRTRPQRTLIVAGVFGLSLILAVLLAALLEYLERLRAGNPEDFRRASYVIDTFFGWIPGVRRRRSGATS